MISVNTHIKKLKPSATLAINQQVKAMRAQGKSIVHFGFGQSPFPIHDTIVTALQRKADCNVYLPTTGLPELKEQLSGFLKKYQQLDFSPEAIYIGPGSKELLFQTIYILEGTFLIPRGSWVSYLPQIQIKNANYAILDTHFKDDFKLTATVLETYCTAHPESQKTLILNTPNNPTGAVYTQVELVELAQVCRKYDIIVLSDEIYAQLYFDDAHAPSISQYYPEKTIVYGGLSKVFSAGGYRLGFMALPKAMQELDIYYKALFSETFSAVAAPIQYAAVAAYTMPPALEQYIEQCTAILRGVAAYIMMELTKLNIRCTIPKGAFYMMIDFEQYKEALKKRGISTSTALASYILEEYGVALLPSTDFYFEEDHLIFRLAFVDFDGKKAHEAYVSVTSVIDEAFIKNYCPNVHLGVMQLQQFLSGL